MHVKAAGGMGDAGHLFPISSVVLQGGSLHPLLYRVNQLITLIEEALKVKRDVPTRKTLSITSPPVQNSLTRGLKPEEGFLILSIH